MLNFLRKFGAWFASPLGIYETVVVLIAWIMLEKFHIVHDNSGYQILYWLTVYSAVTQPVLAFIAYESGKDQSDILEKMEKTLERVETLHSALHPDGEGQVIVRHIEGDGNVLELKPED